MLLAHLSLSCNIATLSVGLNALGVGSGRGTESDFIFVGCHLCALGQGSSLSARLPSQRFLRALPPIQLASASITDLPWPDGVFLKHMSMCAVNRALPAIQFASASITDLPWPDGVFLKHTPMRAVNVCCCAM